MNRDRRVFISATTADLGSYRDAASEQILGRDELRPVQQRYFPPTSAKLKPYIEKQIRNCDAVICLVGNHYGEDVEGAQPRRSHTQREFDLAKSMGKKIFIFFSTDDCEPDEKVTEDADKSALQQKHRSDLKREDHHYVFFSSHDELRLRISGINIKEIPAPKKSTPWLPIFIAIIVAACFGLYLYNLSGKSNPRSELKPEAEAEVTTRPLPDESPHVVVVAPSSKPLSLTFADSYSEGEDMEITLTAHRSGYLYIGAAWADGKVYLLYPNFHAPQNGDNKVTNGQTLNLPSDIPAHADGRELTYPMYFPEGVSGDSATETIFAFITALPVDLPEVDEDTNLGPDFRLLGIVDDKSRFSFRGPKPELHFRNHTFSPGAGVEIVSKDYKITK